jgi:multidrug resistance protein MdtO
MATLTQRVSEWPQPITWLREFLKEELAPYPGRGWLVTRMVTAATIVVIISMTFRIPFGAFGALYALTISRESTETTLKAVRTIFSAFLSAAAYVLAGALIFSSEPNLRLLWVIGTLFLMFYALSAMADYVAAARFGFLIVMTIPVWDSFNTPEMKVEQTLWAVASVLVASIITLLIELLFARLNRWDDLSESITERLVAVERLLNSYITEGKKEQEAAIKQIARLSILGTSRMRRTLQRGTYSPHYAEQMGSAVALVGRLVDIADNLAYLGIQISSEDDRKSIRQLSEHIASIRIDLQNRKIPRKIEFSDAEILHTAPLLREMERTISLMSDVFTGTQSLNAYAPPRSVADPSWRFFAPDAFTNPDHIKFALKGCSAASLCYITYNLVAWPGISTSVATTFLTALTTIGSSRQKQALRIVGAFIGVALGMGAQVFILPSVDTIGGLTVLTIAVTIFAAWVATSSPRFSYCGLQIAVAFYLIHFQEFKMQTSLAVARDRVAGIFLGLFMMWLVFDQLWGVSAGAEMKGAFISALRLLAQFVREPIAKDLRTAIARNFSLRETINKNFDKVRSSADGVWFEFGSSRQRDLAFRSQVLRWQPLLRSLFVIRTTLIKYRFQLPGFELPEEIRIAQQEFDEHLAKLLDGMADRMEGKVQERKENMEEVLERLEQKIQTCCTEEPKWELAAQMQTFLPLSRRIENLAASLNQEI